MSSHALSFSFPLAHQVPLTIHSVDKVLAFRFPPYTAKKLKASNSMAPKLPAKPKGPPSLANPTLAVLGKKQGILGLNKWFVFALAVAIAVGLTRERGKTATWIGAVASLLGR